MYTHRQSRTHIYSHTKCSLHTCNAEVCYDPNNELLGYVCVCSHEDGLVRYVRLANNVVKRSEYTAKRYILAISLPRGNIEIIQRMVNR